MSIFSSKLRFCIRSSIFNNPFSEFGRVEALLSCRLVLNLKRRSQRDQNSFGRISSIRVQEFTNEVVLGNIGAPLRDPDEERDDFMEDTDEVLDEDVVSQLAMDIK